MPAATDYITKYFLTFFVGALFGAVYQYTGAAESIARAIAGLCHGKFVAPIIMCITGILTFGGVSGFVVFFVIYPIALNLFKESNLTRRLIPAANFSRLLDMVHVSAWFTIHPERYRYG